MSFFTRSLEDSLICTYSVCNSDEPHRDFTKLTTGRNLNWDYIVERAELHGVASLLYYNLSRIRDIDVPEDVLKRLRNSYYHNLGVNIWFYNHIGKPIRSFDNQGIKTVVLKGAALARTVYPNIALRSFGDVDVLIDKKDLEKAKSCLEGLGYSIVPGVYSVAHQQNEDLGCEWAFSNGELLLEIHWDLTEKFAPFRVEIEEFWQNLHPVEFDGVHTLVLSPENLLIHLSIHSYKHGWARLREICDVDATARHYSEVLDWECLAKRAQKYRIERPLYYSLCLSKELFDSPIPSFTLNFLKSVSRPDFFWMRWQKVVGSNFIAKEIPQKVTQFLIAKGLKNKFKILHRIIMPTGTFYFLRPFHLLKKYRIHITDFMRHLLTRLTQNRKTRNSKLKRMRRIKYEKCDK